MGYPGYLVAGMATNLHFSNGTLSADKQQIKESIFPSQLPQDLFHGAVIQFFWIFWFYLGCPTFLMPPVNFWQVDVRHKDMGS